MAAASPIPGSVSLASDRALNGAAGPLEYQFINCYFETGVENRPAGTKVVFRVSKAF
jgi:hypothetical protein